MTAKGQTEIERLAALVDRKLSTMERQEKPVLLAELNGMRRLIDWLNRERAIEQSRTVTTVPTPRPRRAARREEEIELLRQLWDLDP